MKIRSLIHIAVSIFIFALISCSNAESSSVERPSALKVKSKKKHVATRKKEKKQFIVFKKKETPKTPAGKPTKEKEKATTPPRPDMVLMSVYAKQLKNYAVQNNYSTRYCFLIDMSVPSGCNRFFVYDLEKSSIVNSALVAHGSCNETFRSRPKFSNGASTGCSSLGRYKVGERYNGKYGNSYRLYGLDNSNSGAYKRGIVIHAYDCVPDKEIYPSVLCNSLGCPMVSFHFFEKLSRMIAISDKPILLWIYN